MIRFACIHCGQNIQMPPEKAGSMTPCPACGGFLQVPGSGDTSVQMTSPDSAAVDPSGSGSFLLAGVDTSQETDIIPAVQQDAPSEAPQPGLAEADYADLVEQASPLRPVGPDRALLRRILILAALLAAVSGLAALLLLNR